LISGAVVREEAAMRFGQLLVPAGCLVAGILLAAWGLRSGTRAWADEKAPPAVDAKSGEALLEAAKTAYQGYLQRRQVDPTVADPEYLYRWSRRWLEAERVLGTTKEKRVAACAAHLERMRTLEAQQEEWAKKGFAAKYELVAAKFYRIEAEQWAAQEKGR
jgi:hypothetical protein